MPQPAQSIPPLTALHVPPLAAAPTVLLKYPLPPPPLPPSLAPDASFGANLTSVIVTALALPSPVSHADAIQDALTRGLTLLLSRWSPDGSSPPTTPAERHRLLLRLPLLEALLHPCCAQLLAQTLDALASQPPSMEGQPEALLRRLVTGCALVASEHAIGTWLDAMLPTPNHSTSAAAGSLTQ